MSSVKSGRPTVKCDKRMTGSTIIDDVLHEVNIHFVNTALGESTNFLGAPSLKS